MYSDLTLQLESRFFNHDLHCDISFDEIKDICCVISDYLFDKYNEVFINNICNDYEFTCINDRINVYKRLKNALKSDKYYIKSINEHLLDYLYNANNYYINDNNAEYKIKLNIDGFAIFRLTEYRERIRSELENIIDEYYIEKEQNEFIDLLKYFISSQNSLIDEIHIVSDFSGRCILRQKNFCELSESCIKAIYEEFEPEEMNEDDLLLSALITLAPNKIFIHNYKIIKNRKVFETILKVFENKCILCDGCKDCSLFI